jgi:hypothetical protein
VVGLGKLILVLTGWLMQWLENKQQCPRKQQNPEGEKWIYYHMGSKGKSIPAQPYIGGGRRNKGKFTEWI